MVRILSVQTLRSATDQMKEERLGSGITSEGPDGNDAGKGLKVVADVPGLPVAVSDDEQGAAGMGWFSHHK
jgi:hypothetical protein